MIGYVGILTLALVGAGEVNQAKIDAVKAGEVTEAKASWWGFDPKDSTRSIQNAIKSGAKRVIIENMGRPWIVTPLFAVSDQEIVLEKGAVIEAKKGEFKRGNDSLLNILNCKNVSLTGHGATVRMHRADYAKPPYSKAEWRNTLQIKSSSNITVTGLTMAESGGDGIYLGVATRGVTNKDIVIRDVVLERHYRQGISVISAENLLIENTVMRETAGTAPMAGIDFEPNDSDEKLVNCVMRNCLVENNEGPGYAFYLPNLTTQSEPISIRLEKCIARGASRFPLSFTNGEGRGQGALTGHVEFVDCDFSGGSSPAVTLSRKPVTGAKVRFENCRFAPGTGDANTPAILFRSEAGNQDDAGGVHFENCIIDDPQGRPVLDFHDRAGDLRLVDVTGTLTVRSGDKTTQVKLTPEFLAEIHPPNTFKRLRKFKTNGVPFRPIASAADAKQFPQHPFSIRRFGQLVVYARQGSEMKLTFKHSQIGKYPGVPFEVTATSPSGQQISAGKVPFQGEATVGFVAPETGLYRLPIDCGPNSFQLTAANCPVVISGEMGRIWFVGAVGTLYLYVPAGTEDFGVKIYGEGQEAVGLEIIDPAGETAWKNPTVTEPEQFVGSPQSKVGEVWTLKLSRPATGPMEDYYIELQGIPPFLATDPSSLLVPAK